MNKLYLAITILTALTLFSGCAEKKQTQMIESLGNATYVDIYTSPVTLSNGRWEGQPFMKGASSRPIIWLGDDIYLQGDLDNDGQDESAVILRKNSGGTGTYSYLAVMSLQQGKMINLATVYIGDRVQIQNGRFNKGEIILNIIQQGKDDAACCPTQKNTVSWKFSDL